MSMGGPQRVPSTPYERRVYPMPGRRSLHLAVPVFALAALYSLIPLVATPSRAMSVQLR
jgi:hypothetical protein